MNRSVILIIFCAFLLLFACSGEEEFVCKDDLGCVTIKPGEPVKIAVLQPLSGRLKDSGTRQIRGIELALNQRNNQLLGHPVELIIEDSQCSPEGGANAALKVVADPGIVGIIGTNCSGAAVEASKIISSAGLVMISGTNSAATLTSVNGKAGPDWNPGYFRTMYNALGRAEAAAIYVYRELGIRKAATIHDNDARAIELVDEFKKVFTRLGGELIIETVIDRGDTNMLPVLNRIASADAEFIFYPIFSPEADYVTQQARQLAGLEDTALMVCGSTVRTHEFIDSVGEAGNGLLFAGKALLRGRVYEQLVDEYRSTYSDLLDNDTYAFSYDAANVLLNAIEKAALSSDDGALHIQRLKLRQHMYATKDYEGATGVLSCDSFGDLGTPEFNILQLKNWKEGVDGLLENEVFTYIPAK